VTIETMFIIFSWFAKAKVIEMWLEKGMFVALLELVTPIFQIDLRCKNIRCGPSLSLGQTIKRWWTISF